jgi:hypothetical protein
LVVNLSPRTTPVQTGGTNEVWSRSHHDHKAVFVTLLGLMASESALMAHLAGTREAVSRVQTRKWSDRTRFTSGGPGV